MFSLSRGRLYAALTAILCIAGVVWLVLDHFLPAPPKTITIGAGSKGGAYDFFAYKYRDIFARHHVTLEVRATDGTVENLKLLNDPKSGIDVGFVQSGVSNSSQAPDLESMGRVNYLAFFIFCRASEKITDLTELKGKRIAIGSASSGTYLVVSKLLKSNNITPENATILPLGGQTAADAMEAGKTDVLILGNVLDAPLIQKLLRDPRLRLISVPRAKAMTRQFPFLTRLELPSGVIDLERNIPATDVTLIGTTTSVLVRSDVHPEIIGLLARTLVDVHGEAGVFQNFGEFPTQTDPEYPMAEAARDYYKNGPSFLQRYLPFWVIIYARRILAILVTAIAIAVPVFSSAPKLYLWFLRRHIMKLYRELRIIERELVPGLPLSRLSAAQDDLDKIDRATCATS